MVVMKKLLSAIKHMHANGIVHRDIKLENILLTSEGEIKIIDFGLSKKQTDCTLFNSRCGTPYYIAPEVISQSAVYTEKSDAWACGVTFYTMLAGHYPFFHDDF